MKKPNKLDLEKNELIVILGKKFNESEVDPHLPAADLTKWGNSSFYFCNDSNVGMPTSIDLESNYSIINPSTVDESDSGRTNLRSPKTAAKPMHKKSASETSNEKHDNDYLSMTYSYLSSSALFSNLLSKSLSSDSLTKRR